MKNEEPVRRDACLHASLHIPMREDTHRGLGLMTHDYLIDCFLVIHFPGS